VSGLFQCGRQSCNVSSMAADCISSLPVQQRAGLLTATRVERAADDLQQRGRCGACALQQVYCICKDLEGLRAETLAEWRGSADSSGDGRGNVVRFALWMHASELRRASNTGKLLSLVLPHKCEVFVHGLAADAERFQEAVDAAGGNAFVLFPSVEAMPVSAVLSAMSLGRGAAAHAEPGTSEYPPPLVVLVDGTWHQAKRMHKALTALPHVALAEDGQSRFGWRKQSSAGRVTTAEAVAAFLEELAHAQTRQHLRDDAHWRVECRLHWAASLRRAVVVLEDALRQQSHYTKSDPPVAKAPFVPPDAPDLPVRNVPCKHYLKGHCRYAAACSFSHGFAEGLIS